MPWNVQQGTLLVDGSLTNSPFTVTGGTLGGTGTIGSLNVQSGGIVAPGHSIGTLNVNGNTAFVAGSLYRVEVNAAGQSDRIAAGGSSHADRRHRAGAVPLSPATSFAPATVYTILTSTAGDRRASAASPAAPPSCGRA